MINLPDLPFATVSTVLDGISFIYVGLLGNTLTYLAYDEKEPIGILIRTCQVAEFLLAIELKHETIADLEIKVVVKKEKDNE